MFVFVAGILFFIINISNNVYSLNACDFHQPIFSDITPDTCYSQEDTDLHFLKYTESNCIPSCETLENTPLNGTDLPPCTQFYNYVNINDTARNLTLRPSCDRDGTYHQLQCKGQPTTGRCFCFDPEGQKIDGQEWWDKTPSITCNCSRKKYNLRSSSDYYYVSLHCDSNGNYEPLQCDIVNNLCWCADSSTGKLLSPLVPMTARSLLSCYNPITMGTEYLRQCETELYARSKILYELGQHGTSNVGYNELRCDEDGTYGLFRVTNGVAYCLWKDSSNVGSFQSPGIDIDALNCNCARDTVIFRNVGKERTQTCELNGNYKQFQSDGVSSYCIDEDGYSFTVQEPEFDGKCQSFMPHIPT